jgi:molybdopterin converting factor small subunit
MQVHDEPIRSESGNIAVICRLFARYAEVVGREEFRIELPVGATVGEAVARLREMMPNGSQLPERPLVAVNREHVLANRVLANGDELAFLPPLAGG